MSARRRHAQRPVKEAGPETALFRRRALAGFALIALCLAVLLGRFAWLQVLHHAEFQGRSEANRIKPRALPPSRGLIFDRNGVLLAENVPSYRLELVPEQAGDVEDTLARLGRVIALSEDELDRFRELREIKRGFESLPVKSPLNETEVARFAVNRHEFPGVEVVPYLTRSYPLGSLFTHVVGYVGRIDAGDRERLADSRYAGTSHIGKTGIERYYEDTVLGQVGYEQVETDAAGRALRVLRRVPPRQGAHVYLTVDAKLQQAVVDAFAGQPGAAVAIDPRNGEILALVSQPTFDPNLFVNGISRADYQALLDAPDRPLYNRALAGRFEPGSTMKPFIALAGLELGVRTPDDTVFSRGEFRLPGMPQVWRDWKRGGHGRVDMTEAIAQSVNTYFYQLAIDIGIDRLGGYLGQFGFGQPTGVDLFGENAGVLPSRSWKQAHFSQPWYPGETVISGIGQGYWVVTPIQMAKALATLADGGVPRTPHLLRAIQAGVNTAPVPATRAADAPRVVRDPAHVAVVRAAMVAVMHSPTGTARAIGAGAAYAIAGKSGTAQRYRQREGETYDERRVTANLRHRALFVAFAPADDPRIAVAVVVERGSSGTRAAAPIARAIVDAWLMHNPP